MDNAMTPEEAMAYFGLTSRDELDTLVLRHGLDVDVTTSGHITVVFAEGMKEALFDEHEVQHGHRPDDPDRNRAERNRLKRNERARAEARRGRRKHLEQRVLGGGKEHGSR